MERKPPSPETVAYLDREKEIEAKCHLRHKMQCSDLDINVGWSCGVTQKTCHECLSRGGPDSPESIAFRDQMAASVIEKMSDPDRLFKASAHIIEVMLTVHLTPVAAQAIRNDPEYPLALTKKERWDKSKPSWEMAESFVRSMVSRGLTNKSVSLPILQQRVASCAACPSRTPSKDGVHHFCDDCGCGDRKLALLDTKPYNKLMYPYLECPRAKEGFSNHVPAPQ